MNSLIKKNLNIIISIFIILQPIFDLITGLCLQTWNINFTFGMIIKMLFFLFIIYTSLFIYKKKKLLIPYIIFFIYSILFIVGTLIYRDSSILNEIQYLFKIFYFPILLVSLYSLRDNIKISKMTLYTTLLIYLLLIFVPILFGVGYKSYEITKVGTLGFFNSANEISGIISILTPIIFIIFATEKNIIKCLIFTIIYLIVILTIGTKTPFLALIITVFLTLIYIWIKNIKNKNYKIVFYSFICLLISIITFILIISHTNFYKNIKTHLDYLKIDNVNEVFENKKMINQFIFSRRLTFLHNKSKIYKNSSIYEKLFGIGLANNTKLIEIDYFDIFYSFGIVGFITIFLTIMFIFYKILKNKQKITYERYMLLLSFAYIIILSFFTGHILTSPSVSLISLAIIISLNKKSKRDLLFAAVSLDIGGIEKALVNLVNKIDLKKYNITIVLEEKKGIFLNKVKDGIIIKEIKVNNSSNILKRKVINFMTKYIYKVFNYKNFDFSCCYATYSYSCSKIALMSSDNSSFYVHNDYRRIYKNIKDFKNFFETRSISKFNNIIFVSNENKNGFVEIYKNLKNKCIVLNNFINTEEIINQSKEPIKTKRNNNKTLILYVGRLDEHAKKISKQINLVENLDNVELWIIGSGPDKKLYEKEIKDKKLEKRIILFGKKDNPFPYMKKADYIIFTSDYEGFPVTYLEALTLNKNIITTFPTSDDKIDIRKYADIISTDEKKMVHEVKKIISNKRKNNKIEIENIQTARMKNLEKIFNGEN